MPSVNLSKAKEFKKKEENIPKSNSSANFEMSEKKSETGGLHQYFTIISLSVLLLGIIIYYLLI